MNQQFIDVLTLKPGRTFDDAEAYFARAMPVIEKHGLTRREVMTVSEKMRGHDDVNPHIVQVWEVRKENPFATLSVDPAYQAMIPTRDSIFEMSKLQGWLGMLR